MKKITLSLLSLFSVATTFGQTFSTGNIQLFPEYTVKIDVTSTLVTLTQIMPNNKWYALAFDNGGAMGGGDIIAFINTANISDRQLAGYQVPIADAVQSWTTISNTEVGTTRTVVSTRALNTGETGDYVFSAAAGSINLACARAGSASFVLAQHGQLANAVATATYAITLANENFDMSSFKLSPNPAKGFTSIQLPSNVNEAQVKIYDNLGRVVRNKSITTSENNLDTSDLTAGSYLVVVRTDYGNATKTLLIE